MVSFVGSRNFSLFPMVTVYPTKRGDTNWYRPPQTRYGAHVASQRCIILRSGKAIILCRNTQLMATPKTQIVLDMGYTLVPQSCHNQQKNCQSDSASCQHCFSSSSEIHPHQHKQSSNHLTVLAAVLISGGHRKPAGT